MSKEFIRDRDPGDENEETPAPLQVMLPENISEVEWLRTMLNRAQIALRVAVKQRTKMRLALEKNEWNGHPNLHQCPECGESRVAGHKQDCSYGDALGRHGAQMCAIGGGC